MGEAKRRGDYRERRATPKGKHNPFARFVRVKREKPRPVRFRSPLSKRERAKIKRAFKRQYGLTRRECGAIGAGHVPGIGA